MKEFQYTITDPEGIHARPAGLLVKKANEFTSKIMIGKGGKSAGCQENLWSYGPWSQKRRRDIHDGRRRG